MSRHLPHRAALAALAAAGLTVAVAAPGSARTEVERYEGLVGWLFDNSTRSDGVSGLEEDLLGVVNGELDGFCVGGEPDTTQVLGRIKDGAVIDIFERNVSTTISLYDGGGLDFFAWAFTVYCPALEAGDAPPPVATGTGILKTRATIDETDFPSEVVIDVATEVRGSVVTGDGDRWVVRLAEEYTVTEEWPPEPGPPLSVEFESHFFGIDVLNRR
ncbi:hypothetical protein [Demequina pelophila]|uniref:hypothetical protein n=1 Tax=Demequina pelophila TaxID=1638984 RepID=UPI0007845577|nr:hypothetical protein [Demequina pelophila]